MAAKREYTSNIIPNEAEIELRRGPWTLEEDTLLTHYIARHGEGRWNLLAKCAGLKRTGKSCRLRWLNYLKPDIKRGNLTPQEQLLILELHSKWGNRWSKIAQHLPGRTDNEIKNYWRTRVQKQARQLNIESNSQGFMDAVRCFWMPRLLQKVEQSSSSSASLIMEETTMNSTKEIEANYDDMNYNEIENNISSSSNSCYYCPPPLPSSTNPISNSIYNDNSSSSYNFSPSDEILVHQTSPSAPIGGYNHNSTPLNMTDHTYNNNGNNCYYVDDMDNNNNYHQGSFNNLPDMSAVDMYDTSTTIDCQMFANNWGSEDMADLWNNMDDIWQFRE
ncbi:hypothetical protein ACFE04_016798 [Oxalis oulophora]